MTAEEIEQEGEFIDAYIVDESQTVSNAGHAEVYRVGSVMYQIVTWNHVAVEHEAGQKTVSIDTENVHGWEEDEEEIN